MSQGHSILRDVVFKTQKLSWWTRLRLRFARRWVAFDPGFLGKESYSKILVYKVVGGKIYVVDEHDVPKIQPRENGY